MNDGELSNVHDAETVRKSMRKGNVPPIHNYFDDEMLDFGEISVSETPVKEYDEWKEEKRGKSTSTEMMICFGGPVGQDLVVDLEFGPVKKVQTLGPKPSFPTQPESYITASEQDTEQEFCSLRLGFPSPPPQTSAVMAGNYRGSFGGGRFNRGGGRSGSIEQNRNFSNVNSYGDRFRNNYIGSTSGNGAGGGGINKSHATEKVGAGNGGGVNLHGGQMVWREKVGQMEISGPVGGDQCVIGGEGKGNGGNASNPLMEPAQQRQLLSALLSQLAQTMSAGGLGLPQAAAGGGGEIGMKGKEVEAGRHGGDKLILGGNTKGNGKVGENKKLGNKIGVAQSNAGDRTGRQACGKCKDLRHTTR